MLAGECGSLFKLPALYPGTSAAGHQGPLPTHVHKRGCGPTATDSTTRANCRAGLNDHMTLGFWSDGSGVNDAGKFTAAGPERSVDKGCLYAGKDLHDVPNGRRLFWGWITCTTAGAQTLPRVVTYHPTLRQLVFSPAPELTKLHAGAPLAQLGRTTLKAKVPLSLGSKAAKGAMAADWNISFARPKGDATVGLTFNTNFDAEGGAMTVFVNHTAGASQVSVGVYDGAPQYPCPAGRDVLQLLPTDEELTLRVFTDSHVLEMYWMDGRVAMVVPLKGPKPPAKPCVGSACAVAVFSSGDAELASATAWAMRSIWVAPGQVLAAPRRHEGQ